ncbi:threonine dehydratase [Psychromarinibacter halotolerans]|uniref:Threonine dehydratase n=1 Tax=Psychromarinibacter halotolerans TaxID=1775175 RepID=A0ABV7GQ75_9RHOB|nr:threonine dehydratase [Psychromarinibacter halotolerans]MDF0597196.1 threonine dehydratase [Psychromarinibacter halotolerans]
MQLSEDDLKRAADLVYTSMPATPQYAWPQLKARLGCEVWVKHENHTPTGAFKVRGGITFIDWLRRTHPDVAGICTATRGNHGQSQARAATAAGLRALVYVPHGNSVEKNASMRAFGAELVEHGQDFDTARVEAFRVAEEQGLAIVPPFHKELVRGVATYAYELFTAAPDLDAVYVPIGCGSGICGTILARDALGLKTEVIAVVAEGAPCARLSVEAGRLVETNTADTFADGMAVRVPVQAAFDIYAKGASRFVTVSDAEIAQAMRVLYEDTHNLAEGSGAAALAALMQEKDAMAGRKAGVILSGGNVDAGVFADVLAGGI